MMQLFHLAPAEVSVKDVDTIRRRLGQTSVLPSTFVAGRGQEEVPALYTPSCSWKLT
jgi:hypothetical protein